jgi:hypothetical protein
MVKNIDRLELTFQKELCSLALLAQERPCWQKLAQERLVYHFSIYLVLNFWRFLLELEPQKFDNFLKLQENKHHQ